MPVARAAMVSLQGRRFGRDQADTLVRKVSAGRTKACIMYESDVALKKRITKGER